MTVFDYINHRRLECSRQLLDSGSLQVRQIADQLGYRNPGDFTRAFRRHFGVTSREYRRSTEGDFEASSDADASDEVGLDQSARMHTYPLCTPGDLSETDRRTV